MKRLSLLSVLLLAGGCSVLQVGRPPDRDAAMRLEQGLASLDAGLYLEAFDDLAWVYTNCAGYEAGYRALAGLAALELDPRNEAGREKVGGELLGRFIQDPGPPTWSRPLAESAYLMALALGAQGQPERAADPTTDSTASAPVGGATPTAGGAGSPATAEAADSVTGATAALEGSGGPEVSGARSWRAIAWSSEDSTGADGASGEAHADPRGARMPPPVPAPRDGGVRGCGSRVASPGWVAPGLPTLPGPSMMTILARAEADREGLAARADSLQRALAAAQRELQETRSELERIRKTLKP